MKIMMPPRRVPIGVHDEEERKEYKCCCGIFDITTGAALIGMWELLFILASLVPNIYRLAERSDGAGKCERNCLSLQIAGECIEALFIGMLFYGILHEKASFLIPQIILQVSLMSTLLVFWFGAIYLFFYNAGFIVTLFGLDPRMNLRDFGRELSTMLSIAMIFLLWTTSVLVDCYLYLRDEVGKDRRRTAMEMSVADKLNGPQSPVFRADRPKAEPTAVV